jgi:hypothetical protein
MVGSIRSACAMAHSSQAPRSLPGFKASVAFHRLPQRGDVVANGSRRRPPGHLPLEVLHASTFLLLLSSQRFQPPLLGFPPLALPLLALETPRLEGLGSPGSARTQFRASLTICAPPPVEATHELRLAKAAEVPP